MKRLKNKMLIATMMLFGLSSEQKAAFYAPGEQVAETEVVQIKKIDKPCLSLARDKFTEIWQGKYFDYVNFLNEVCIAYDQLHPKIAKDTSGNSRIERLLWEALIEKKTKAIEILLDLVEDVLRMVSVDPSLRKFVIEKNMVTCLKEVGEERCLANTVARTVGGAFGAANAGLFIGGLQEGKREVLEDLQKEEECVKKEVERKIQTFVGGVTMGAAAIAIAGGALALEGFYHAYQSRQERIRWNEFKVENKNYEEILANAFNNFVEDTLLKLHSVNELIKDLFNQKLFGSNAQLHASLQDVVKHLNKGSWTVSAHEMQKRFACLLSDLQTGKQLTMVDLQQCGLKESSFFRIERSKHDFSWEVFKQLKYQKEIAKLLMSNSYPMAEWWNVFSAVRYGTGPLSKIR
jgi:vacuolar-type H+-ATPase subunit E/Vma4